MFVQQSITRPVRSTFYGHAICFCFLPTQLFSEPFRNVMAMDYTFTETTHALKR